MDNNWKVKGNLLVPQGNLQYALNYFRDQDCKIRYYMVGNHASIDFSRRECDFPTSFAKELTAIGDGQFDIIQADGTIQRFRLRGERVQVVVGKTFTYFPGEESVVLSDIPIALKKAVIREYLRKEQNNE